jgi:dephospho-CoA kinase
VCSTHLVKTIALTGGIASGKSTVSEMLRRHGAAVIDADAVAREVVEPGRPALLEIVTTFGPDVVGDDGSLDRKALGDIVFSDENARIRIEEITHPRIRERMAELSQAAARSSPPLLVHDIPLLFETGRHRDYNGVLVIYIPRALQLERLISREGFSSAEAEQRVGAQLPIDEKRDKATWVIDNSGTVEQTRSRFEAWWSEEFSGNGSA